MLSLRASEKHQDLLPRDRMSLELLRMGIGL